MDLNGNGSGEGSGIERGQTIIRTYYAKIVYFQSKIDKSNTKVKCKVILISE